MAKKLFYETEEFRKLKAKWDTRLEDSGFIDIEKGETDTVIRPQVIKTQKTQYDGGSNYYEFCQAILREFRFKKDIHRVMFSYHADGMSDRQIVKLLKAKGVTFSQKGINLLIRRVKESYIKGHD